MVLVFFLLGVGADDDGEAALFSGVDTGMKQVPTPTTVLYMSQNVHTHTGVKQADPHCFVYVTEGTYSHWYDASPHPHHCFVYVTEGTY